MSAEAWTRSDPVCLRRLGGGSCLRAVLDEVLMGGGAPRILVQRSMIATSTTKHLI